MPSSQFSDLPNLLIIKYTSHLKELSENTPARIHTTTQGPWPSLKNDLANALQKKAHKDDTGYPTNKFFRTGKKCLKWISLCFTKLCLNFRGRFFLKPKFSGAVRIVRKEMFTQKYTFYGSFEANSVRFHHHWYLSSIWFFMVLTLKYKLAL